MNCDKTCKKCLDQGPENCVECADGYKRSGKILSKNHWLDLKLENPTSDTFITHCSMRYVASTLLFYYANFSLLTRKKQRFLFLISYLLHGNICQVTK